MSRDIIVCENMGKIFETSRGQVPVIEDVTLQVRENEFLVLFGPGQCGKSTMINCMSGLEPVTEGKVEVNGKIVSGPSPDRGVVYQRMALFPWLTVMGNVEYGPKVRGVPKQERRERALHYIELVGLKGFENSFSEPTVRRNAAARWELPGSIVMNRRFCLWMNLLVIWMPRLAI